MHLYGRWKNLWKNLNRRKSENANTTQGINIEKEKNWKIFVQQHKGCRKVSNNTPIAAASQTLQCGDMDKEEISRSFRILHEKIDEVVSEINHIKLSMSEKKRTVEYRI